MCVKCFNLKSNEDVTDHSKFNKQMKTYLHFHGSYSNVLYLYVLYVEETGSMKKFCLNLPTYSIRYDRPMKFVFPNETKELITQEIGLIEQIISLTDISVNLNKDGTILVISKLPLSIVKLVQNAKRNEQNQFA